MEISLRQVPDQKSRIRQNGSSAYIGLLLLLLLLLLLICGRGRRLHLIGWEIDMYVWIGFVVIR